MVDRPESGLWIPHNLTAAEERHLAIPHKTGFRRPTVFVRSAVWLKPAEPRNFPTAIAERPSLAAAMSADDASVRPSERSCSTAELKMARFRSISEPRFPRLRFGCGWVSGSGASACRYRPFPSTRTSEDPERRIFETVDAVMPILSPSSEARIGRPASRSAARTVCSRSALRILSSSSVRRGLTMAGDRSGSSGWAERLCERAISIPAENAPSCAQSQRPHFVTPTSCAKRSSS